MTQRLKRFCALCVTALLLLTAGATDYPYENLATGGTPSYAGASYHTGGNDILQLFDGNASTYFGFNLSAGNTLSVVYELPEAKVVNAYGIQCGPSGYYGAASRAPKTFSFEAYDEGLGEWVALDSRTSETGWANGELRVYKFVNETAYKKYRLAQTAPTSYTGFAEFQFYYIDTRDTLVVESDAEEFGTSDPGYGTHTGMTVGGVVTCTLSGADQTYTGADGYEYKFFGYEVWGNADTDYPELISAGNLPSVTYRQESYTKVVWKWCSPTKNLATGGTVVVEGGVGRRDSYPSTATVSVLCDDNAATFYGFSGAKTDGSFHVVNTLPSPTVVNAYALQCGPSTYYSATTRAPQTFSFEGYDEGTAEWVTLDVKSSETGWTVGQERLYKFTNTTAYKKYRLVVTAPSGDVGFAELKFFYIDSRDVLKVESDVEEFGTPDPAYGEHEGQPLGGEVTCTIAGADETYTSTTGGKYVFAGYEVWGKADTGTPELIDAGTETNVTYTQSSYTKLVWKWGMAPMRVATDGNDSNNGFDAPMATIAAAVAAAKLAGQSISVEAGEYAISAALTIEKDVRIYANGGEVIVRGAGSHKLLTLNHASASVEGITFVNGKATGSRDYTGSSLIASGVEVTAGTLRNCIVTGCDSDGYGTPALLAKGENALVKGCTISNNTARCTDSNKRYYALHGGGLGITSGTVEDCLIAGNRGGSATGVWQSGGTVRNCTISGNIGSHEQTGEASTLGTEACAWDTVFMKGGTMTGCTITRNVAASAAGAYLIGTAKMSGCTVSFNRATMDRPMTVAASDMMTSEHQPTDISHRQPFGGVILGSVNAAVENCLIATNFADTCGYDQGLHVIAGTATGNTFDANGEDANTSKSTSSVAYVVPDDGETGTWPYDTEAKAARSIQAAVDAVAASRENPGTVFLAAGTYLPPEGVKRFVTLKRPVCIVGPADGSAILSGSSRQGVRGFWIAHDFAEISHLTFLGFSSAAGDGVDEAGKGCYVAGALYAGKVSECEVSGCAQYNYTSPTALWMFGGTLTQSEVSGCFTTGSGGENQRGGGVRTYGGVIEDCLISDNRASYGGGVFVAGSAAVIRRTRIVGNEASGYNTVLMHPGAGVFMNAGGRVESCLITGNYGNATAAGYTGAGIYMSAGTVANCTVAGNTHKTAGLVGGVHITGGTLVNSIVWGNTAGGSDSDVTVGGGSVTYTCYSEAENEANNFAEDPCFKGRGREPYALRSVSPCTGKGDASIWTADDLDLVGSPRLRGALVDLGAYSVRNPGLLLMVK